MVMTDSTVSSWKGQEDDWSSLIANDVPLSSTATLKLLNSGIYFVTGSFKSSISSSTRSIASEIVMILLIDHIRIHVPLWTIVLGSNSVFIELCSYRTLPSKCSKRAYKNGKDPFSTYLSSILSSDFSSSKREPLPRTLIFEFCLFDAQEK